MKPVKHLLLEALKEEDPQRAIELFLAARLLYLALRAADEARSKHASNHAEKPVQVAR